MANGFFANIFKTGQVKNGNEKSYKPFVKNLFDFLSTYIISEDHKPEINKKIQTFLSRPIDVQLDKLPSFYLFMEQFILNVNRNKNVTTEALRKSVKARFPHLAEQIPTFRILFSGNEEQIFQLYLFFLKELSLKLGNILGTSGNNKWSELGDWLNTLPESQTPVSFITIDKKPSGYKEWNELLIKVSLSLYADIEQRFSGDFVKRFYQGAYESLSSSYKNLDNFHEILKLFPNKILDEDKVNLLSNQQIKLLLLEKIESLENLSLELMSKNQALTEARSTIEEQNEELKSYSEDLETQVKKRTAELNDKNRELIRYNNQLEQYAFTISHHLRGPVARLLGLASIFSFEEDTHLNNHVIVPKISESARQLDDILKDLNRIIDIKKGVNVLGPVDIKLILERLKGFFHTELEEANAILDIDLGEVKPFYSNGLYIESVFYNMISNAVKFRSPERQLHIKINASLSTDRVYFHVSDNGLGIDLEMFKDKIFSLYQRFHLHVEGKGIGLHISKEQIEALGGDIDIESTPDKGAVFMINLPYTNTPKN